MQTKVVFNSDEIEGCSLHPGQGPTLTFENDTHWRGHLWLKVGKEKVAIAISDIQRMLAKYS